MTTAFGVLLLGNLLFTQMGLHFEAHQSLICLKETNNEGLCKNRLTRRARQWLWFGALKDISFQGNTEKDSSILVQWSLEGKTFRVRRALSWEKVLRRRDFSL
jgi:hypothetical protein